MDTAKKLADALRELLAAADQCINPANGDDVAAMVRFGVADDHARELIAEFDSTPAAADELEYKMSCFIDYATGGKASKPNIELSVLKSLVDERIADLDAENKADVQASAPEQVALTDEQVRELFEASVKKSAIASKTPLNIVTLNGAFHHYFDADTDTMWLGYRAGYRRAALAASQPAPVEAKAENPESHPNNRVIFKRLCQIAGIELGTDRISDAYRKIDALRAALSTPVQAQAVAAPEGFVLVPVEPTGQVLGTLRLLRFEMPSPGNLSSDRAVWDELLRVAAAPTPSKGEV